MAETQLCGRLQIHVNSARNLKGKTQSVDAYCVLSANKTKTADICTTKTINGTSNPTWDQSFILNVPSPLEVFQVVVWHRNPGVDDFLGELSIPLLELYKMQSAVQGWMPLKSQNGTETNSEINFSMQYRFVPAWKHVYEGILQIQNKQCVEAIRTLTEAVAAVPSESSSLLCYRSQAYLMSGHNKEALHDAKTCVTSNPTFPTGYYRLGLTLEAYGEKEKAIKVYQKGLSFNQKNEELRSALHVLQGYSTSSKSKGHLPQDNNELDAFQTATALFNRKDYHNAKVQFSKAIDCNKDNFVYYLYRSITNLALKSMSSALKDINTAASLSPIWPKEKVIKDGYLKKEGHVNKMKKRRWFSLKAHYLFYYAKDREFHPSGVVALYEARLKRVKANKLIVLPFSGNSLVLASSTRDAMDAWEEALNSAISLPLALPNVDNVQQHPVNRRNTSVKDLISNAGLDKEFAKVKRAKKQLNNSKQKLLNNGFLVPNSLHNVIKDGYIYRQRRRSKRVQMLFFALKSNALYYFNQRPIRTKGNLYAEGMIEINANVLVRIDDTKNDTDKFHFQLITELKTYHMYCDKQKDVIEWEAAINSAKRRLCGADAEAQAPRHAAHNNTHNNSHNNTHHNEHAQSSTPSYQTPQINAPDVIVQDSSPTNEPLNSNNRQSIRADNSLLAPSHSKKNAFSDTDVNFDEYTAYGDGSDDDAVSDIESDYSQNSSSSSYYSSPYHNELGNQKDAEFVSSSEKNYFARFGLTPPTETVRSASFNSYQNSGGANYNSQQNYNDTNFNSVDNYNHNARQRVNSATASVPNYAAISEGNTRRNSTFAQYQPPNGNRRSSVMLAPQENFGSRQSMPDEASCCIIL